MITLFNAQVANAVSTEFIEWKCGAATLIIKGDLNGGTIKIKACDTVDGTYQDVTGISYSAPSVVQLPEFGYGLFIKAEFSGSGGIGAGVTVIVAPVATELKAKLSQYSEDVFTT